MLLVFVLLYRELAIGALRTICALRGFALGARKSGKIKAVIQAVVCFLIVILMIPYFLGIISQKTLYTVSLISVSFAALYSVFSLVEYLYVNRLYIKMLVKD